jgi:hypothetical protein
VDRTIIGTLRALAWLALLLGVGIGVFLLATALLRSTTSTSSFDSGMQAALTTTSLIFAVTSLFSGVLAWALLGTIAIIADALLDIRALQYHQGE